MLLCESFRVSFQLDNTFGAVSANEVWKTPYFSNNSIRFSRSIAIDNYMSGVQVLARTDRYRLSFISGGMFIRESTQAFRIYARTQDWDRVQTHLIDEHIVSYKTLSSAKRLSREVVLRLRSLEPHEAKFALDADFEERRALLWIAICRTYEIIPDFVRTVLTERLLALRTDLSPQDFEQFLEGRALLHCEVDRLAPSTRTKLRTVLYRMMNEAGFYDKKEGLKSTYIPASVRRLIEANIPSEIRYFPGQDS